MLLLRNYKCYATMITALSFYQFGVFEMDKLSNAVVPCPLLLEPSKYKPDLEDLVADEKAREYWLDCFETGLDMV